MRVHAAFAFAAVLIAAPASAYNVTISADPTSNGSIISGVFKATGPDAVLNFGDLQTALATSDVKVLTTTHGTQAGDIIVAHKITWAANTLTLDAYHSIVINRKILPTATSALSLTTNDGGSGGDLVFNTGGAVAFDSTAQSLEINAVPYTLVDRVGLMAADISGNPSGNFALAHNDTETTTFGSTPVNVAFTGNFEGLGNRIINLTIIDNTDTTLAFFGSLGSLATLKDLILVNINVQESIHNNMDVAGLVLFNGGLISNVSISGTVKSLFNLGATIGGLAMLNTSTGRIVNCSSSATVSTAGPATIGGIAEENDGSITLSSGAGDVIGGGSSTAGTLVGTNHGSITLSSAKGNLSSAGGTLGGLVGNNSGTIDQSFAMGDIDSSGGTANDGGFVGINTGTIGNAYAKGAIAGQNGSTMGGFVGTTSATSNIATSYATGAPAGGTTIGGFAGFNNAAATSASLYWNTTSSGTAQATGNGNDTGITGLTSTQMRSGLPAGFSSVIWAETTGTNNGFPYLVALPPS